MGDKQKKKLLAVLGVFAVFSIIRGAAAPVKAKHSVFPESKTVVEDDFVEQPLFSGKSAVRTRHAKWGRDPFTLQSINASGRAILNGIIWDIERPLSIINNEIVKIGDKIAGNTVIDIKQDKVILNNGVGNFEVRLD